MNIIHELGAMVYLPFMPPAKLAYKVRQELVSPPPFWVRTYAFTLYSRWYRDYLFEGSAFESDYEAYTTKLGVRGDASKR